MDIDYGESRPVNLVHRGVQHGLRLEIPKEEGLALLAALGLAGCQLAGNAARALQQKVKAQSQRNVSQVTVHASQNPIATESEEGP